jgi:hypothetical protein
MSIESELLDLQDAAGMIHAARVVEWAAANPGSDLNPQFDWDNESAGPKYRLQQARRLISIHIRFEEQPERRGTISLVPDRRNGGGYRAVGDVMRNSEMRQQALRQALLEARRWQENYRWLSELARVFEQLDLVAEEAEVTAASTPPQRRRRAVGASPGIGAAL